MEDEEKNLTLEERTSQELESEEIQVPDVQVSEDAQTLSEFRQSITQDDPRHPAYVGDPSTHQFHQPDLNTTDYEQQESQPNILSETGAALVGGAADAVESVGGFVDLTGDTLKAGVSQLFGKPVASEENPFHEDYEHGNWLDIPDDWVPENKTALGKLARGFVEFGLLTAATGSVGGAAFGGARLGTRGLALARSSGVGARGSKYIKFLGKTSKIAAEGGVADLVSTASEDANMANLVNEFAPWMPFSQALAVDPDDNPWLARIKTVTAGAGINLVGWRIASYAKGRWAAKKAYKAGKTIDEANDIGNQVDADEYIKLANQSEEASTATAAEAFAEGRGISHSDPRTEYVYSKLDEAEADRYTRARSDADNTADRKALEDLADARGKETGDVFDAEAGYSPSQASDATRQTHPKVNPGKYLDAEKADIVTSKPEDILKTSIKELKEGGSGRSWQHMWTTYSLKRMTGGSARRLKLLERTRDELVEKAFKSPDNTTSYNDLLQLTDHHISEGLDIIMDGNDIANRFTKLLKEDPNNYRVFMTDGVEIKTITPAQKAAVQLNMAMLADTATSIAQSALEVVDNVPINTQYEQVMDAMKALLVEHKRFGVMWGLDGVAQQLDQIPENLAKQAKKRLADIDENADEYFSALDELRKQNRWQEMKGLMEIHAITGNKINTLEQVHDFLNASLGWGTKGVHGVEIRGMKEQQLLATWYNSILSSVRTPIKAIAGTNLITVLRPFQAYLGAWGRGDRTEMVVAASMIDSLRKGWAEGMDMFKYNWDAGVHRKSQSYDIRYDLESDLAQWKQIGTTIDTMGTDSQKRAYGALNSIVGFNTNPMVRYSTNAMGAGDALARTLIGRMEMRHRAVRKALEDGVDITDAKKVAQATEENFRNSIFKEGKDGKWIVHDKAAMMAGDEAAMTRNLTGVARIFDDINTIPVFRAFFPFARTGINALNLTFEHVPVLARTQRKFRDILSGDPERLAQWGIRPEDAGNARAMAEGRLMMGKSIMGMTAMTAMMGNMTGDYPYDKERRDLWRLNQIPPYSIKIGDTWVSYRNIEPFNTVAAMAANVVHNADVLGESLVDEWYAKIGFMFSAIMVDKTMLSGVKELFAIADHENAGNRGKMVARTLASKLRPVIPFASMSKDIGNMINPIKHEAESLGEQILKNDLLLKSLLHPQYDVLNTDRSGKAYSMNNAEFEGAKGTLNPLLRIFNAISPMPIIPAQKIRVNGTYEPDPVKETLLVMRYNIPEVISTYKGIRLNSRQRSRLQYYLSTGDLRKELERIIYPKNSIVRQGVKEYKAAGLRESEGAKLSSFPWYQAVHQVFRNNIDLAMAQVLAEDATLRRRVDSRKLVEITSKQGDTNRAKYYQDLQQGNVVPTR